MNTAAELEFVQSKAKDLADIEDFYIGGSGDRDTRDTYILEYSEYSQDSSSKRKIISFFNFGRT